MSRARFSQLSRVREMLEGSLAELAASRATPAVLRRLSETNDAMRRSVAEDDFHEALAHNMAFHFTLYESAGEEVMLPLIEMMWLQAGPFLALSLTMPGARWTARHHQAAITALRVGNRSAARRAIEADIQETRDHLLAKGVFADEAAASRLSVLPPG